MAHAIPFTKHEEVFAEYFGGGKEITLRNTMEALDSIHAHAIELFSESTKVNIFNGQTDDGEEFTGPCTVTSLSIPSADQFDLGALLVCSGTVCSDSCEQSIVVYIMKRTEIICYM